MPVESVFPRLEPLLAERQQADPVRGRRAQLHRQGLGLLRRALGADVPRRLRGRRAQPGRHDPLRGAQRAAGDPRRAHLRGLAGHGERHARARRPGVHRRRAPAGRRVRRAGRVLRHRARLHQPAADPRPGRHPAARPATAPIEHPVVVAGGHSAFNPEPVADFVDAAVLGDGEQAVLADQRGRAAAGRPRARPGGRDELLLRLARTGGVYVPGVLRRRVPPRRPDQAGRAQPPGRAVAGRQAHGDGPRRVAVPEAAARAAGRVGARAGVGGDLPRLHARLPVLPGRDDHPAGARALDHRRRRDGREGAGRAPVSRRSGCCRCPAPTTARSRR